MSQEERAIQGVTDALIDAFNAKDAGAFAALFAEDAEFVNIFGGRMRGRAAIEAGHRAAFAGPLAGARAVPRSPLETKLLAPDVALAHLPWTRERLPGTPEATLSTATGIFTIVLRRGGDRWSIAALTNVQDGATPGAKK